MGKIGRVPFERGKHSGKAILIVGALWAQGFVPVPGFIHVYYRTKQIMKRLKENNYACNDHRSLI